MKCFTLCARFEILVCILHSQHVSIESSSIPRDQQPRVAPAPHWSKWAPQSSHLWPYQGLGIRTCINPASRNCRTQRLEKKDWAHSQHCLCPDTVMRATASLAMVASLIHLNHLPFHDVLSHLCRACEPNFPHIGMVRESLADQWTCGWEQVGEWG